MRNISAIAFAATFVLTCMPASANETCPLNRAVYTSKADADFVMTFQEHAKEMHGVVIEIAHKDMSGEHRIADLYLTQSIGYAVPYVVGRSPVIQSTPGSQPLGSRFVALNADFSEASLGGPEATAPYAIVMPSLATQFHIHTKNDGSQPKIPEGAWIRSACRQ